MGIRARLRGERGAAAVEFALILIPLTFLLVGVAQMGLTLFKTQALQAAAREGARVASLTQTTALQAKTQASSALPSTMTVSTTVQKRVGASLVTVADTQQPCNYGAGTRPSVLVTTSHSTTIQIVSYSRTLTLVGKGEFTCE